LGGAVAQLAALQAMEHRLGEVGEPLREGPAGRLSRLAKGLTIAGTVAIGGAAARSRAAAIAGGVALTAGTLAERWSVFRAGFQSAADPKYTVGPQRRRIEEGATRGGARREPRADLAA
jgi:hypothetical protein